MSPAKLFKTFFKLGLFAFGGPAAHIGLFEDKFVVRDKLIERSFFLDMIGATNLIPGPNSTEMTMHIGHHLGGRKGMFAAGAGFIIPAVTSTLLVAWFYLKYKSVPEVAPLLWGIQAVVLAIIAGAVFKLGKKAIKNNATAFIGAAALIAALLEQPEVLIILFAGLLLALWAASMDSKGPKAAFLWAMLPTPVVEQVTKEGSLWEMGWVFLKTGAVLFGSGYVLVAYLEADLVDRLGWMTQPELLDAIALGQLTPGPVLSTATFVGYQLHGFAGAAVATLGIFLPSFFFVMLSHPIIPKLRKSRIASAFLDGANAAAMGVMAAVLFALCYQMFRLEEGAGIGTAVGGGILLHFPAIVLAIGSFLLLRFVPKFNPIWLVPAGALLGYLCKLAGWL